MFNISIFVYEFADLCLYCVGTKGALNLLNSIIKYIKIDWIEKILSNVSFQARFMHTLKAQVQERFCNVKLSTNN